MLQFYMSKIMHAWIRKENPSCSDPSVDHCCIGDHKNRTKLCKSILIVISVWTLAERGVKIFITVAFMHALTLTQSMQMQSVAHALWYCMYCIFPHNLMIYVVFFLLFREAVCVSLSCVCYFEPLAINLNQLLIDALGLYFFLIL